MYIFEHPNVLTLCGVCLDGGTAPYIIMPFMANGSLLSYLRNNRKTLVVSDEEKDEDEVWIIQTTWHMESILFFSFIGECRMQMSDRHEHSGCQGDGVSCK